MSELADQLRELHLPEPVGWWPPAPGWWIVASITLVTMGWAILQAWRRRSHTSNDSRSLRGELSAHFETWKDTQATALYYRYCSEALRRKAIGISGRDVVSRLSGERWVNWLDAHTLTPLSDDVRAVLADGVYHRAPPERVPDVHRELLRWANDNA